MKKQYKSEDLVVNWDSEKCTHSKNCWKGLVSVFNPQKKPWINLDEASADEVKNQIDKCPSGALSYEGDEKQNISDQVDLKKGTIIAKKEPAHVFVDGGKSYKWCACGKSVNQPFCDSTHKADDARPRIFKEEKTKDVWLCLCKQTNNPPYCDGSHNKL